MTERKSVGRKEMRTNWTDVEQRMLGGEKVRLVSTRITWVEKPSCLGGKTILPGWNVCHDE